MKDIAKTRVFPSAHEDAKRSSKITPTEQTLSPSYRLAYVDQDFMLRDELRPTRLHLELLKPELILKQEEIDSTIVVFGSARVSSLEEAKEHMESVEAALEKRPDDPEMQMELKVAQRRMKNALYYEEARRFAQIVSECSQKDKKRQFVIITGGGPGIMEAANRGAYDIGTLSIGLNIVLPTEQIPNKYITPGLCFQFHYFGIRKMHFLMRAKALVIFPGGFGTLDELSDVLTLIQTKKIKPVPVLLFGKEYWRRVIDFEFMAQEGFIRHEDLKIFRYVGTAQEAWDVIRDFYCK